MKKALVLLASICFLSVYLCSCFGYETTEKITESSSDARVTYTYIPNDYLVISGSTDVSRPLSDTDISAQIAQRVKYIELSNGITGLGTNCFSKFTRLEFIRIPPSVLYIESDVFDSCPNKKGLTVWFDIGEDENEKNGYSYSLNESCDYTRYWEMKYASACKRVMDEVKENGYLYVADYQALPFSMLYNAIDEASSEDRWLGLNLNGYNGSVLNFSGSVARKINALTLDFNQSFQNLSNGDWQKLDDFQIIELSLPVEVRTITPDIIEMLHSGAPENLRIYYWGTRDEWNTLTSGWDWDAVSQWEVYTSDDY